MFAKVLKISWRSLWRNGRRTAITGLAVGLGLAALVFTEALMEGMGTHMVRTVTGTWMGDAQIHGESFSETRDIDDTVRSAERILSMLEADDEVEAYTPRILSPATLRSARELRPVTLAGVDRATDPGVTLLESAMIEGSYLTGDSMEIIVGRRLADDLKVRQGDVLVATAAGADSTLASTMFLLSGICSFGSEEQDRYTAFINLDAADGLLGMEGRMHEIAVRFPSSAMGADTSLGFRDRYALEGNTVRGWPELSPQVGSMLDMVDLSMGVMAVILFGLVIFIILNSLFMSVYERMFEFSVMKAVGTAPIALGSMVVMEAFWLGLLSTLAGMVLGTAVVWVTSNTGVSFGEIEFSGVVFDRPIIPELNPSRLWPYPLGTVLVTVVAGVFPAVHASRLNPARSMRRSL